MCVCVCVCSRGCWGRGMGGSRVRLQRSGCLPRRAALCVERKRAPRVTSRALRRIAAHRVQMRCAISCGVLSCCHSATVRHRVHSARSRALAIRPVGTATASSWTSARSALSTCELRDHCRSDPVQVQSTGRVAAQLQSARNLCPTACFACSSKAFAQTCVRK